MCIYIYSYGLLGESHGIPMISPWGRDQESGDALIPPMHLGVFQSRLLFGGEVEITRVY